VPFTLDHSAGRKYLMPVLSVKSGLHIRTNNIRTVLNIWDVRIYKGPSLFKNDTRIFAYESSRSMFCFSRRTLL
jgi:hypothetical protein